MSEQDEEIARLEARLKELKAAKEASSEVASAPIRGVAKEGGKPNYAGWVVLGVCGVGLFLWLAAQGSKPANSTPPLSPTTPETVEVVQPVAEAPKPVVDQPKWNYTSDVDPMTDKKTETACVTSTNEVRQGFPYGNSSARLCIRQSPKWGTDVYVVLNGDGQIICRSYDNCTHKVRFGDKEQMSFSAADSSDGSSNITFITNHSRFISNVNTADVTKVEIQLYQNGSQILDFPTKGLEWPRPAA